MTTAAEKKATDEKKAADAGTEQVQAATDEAESKGYIGTVPDENPNSAYSLQSGPESP